MEKRVLASAQLVANIANRDREMLIGRMELLEDARGRLQRQVRREDADKPPQRDLLEWHPQPQEQRQAEIPRALRA